MALLIIAAVFVALQVYNVAVLLSMKIVVKSGGLRCVVVAIGGFCCIKKLVTITFAFMTSHLLMWRWLLETTVQLGCFCPLL